MASQHAGNLLIRPVPISRVSRSKYNFEIVLLDHGLWFDISESLRTNYARLWLSLLQPKTEKVDADRRKYAQLVGNIGPDLFPVFETAITGRAGVTEIDDPTEQSGLKRTLDGSLLGLAVQTPEETQRLRNAFMQEGMLESVFDLLRRVPRRLLMVLKIKFVTVAVLLNLTNFGDHKRSYPCIGQVAESFAPCMANMARCGQILLLSSLPGRSGETLLIDIPDPPQQVFPFESSIYNLDQL